MSPRRSLVLAGFVALVAIASMVGQMEDIIAQNQTVGSSMAGRWVMFESPTTLILRVDNTDALGDAIDIAKQSGYKIDSVITEEPNAVYMVFMSKG